MVAAEWGITAERFARYLLTAGKSPETARTYCGNISLFWRWCLARETCPLDADKSTVQLWLEDRLKKVSGSRTHSDLAALRAFFLFLQDEAARPDDPCKGLKIKRPKRMPTKPLAGGELHALLGACKNERDRLMILFLAHTGLRISEFAALTAEGIDWTSGQIVITGKGDKQRPIEPHPDVMAELRAYLGFFHEGALWLSLRSKKPLSPHQIRKILYDIANRAGVEHVHPHRFRAFFATEYMDQFGDIQALQGVMGHESIETTARYAEYTKFKRGLDYMRRLTWL